MANKPEEIIPENEPQFEKRVRVKIPVNRKDKSPVFVSVNDRTWMIKRGEYVEVPECVAEVLQHSEDAENALYAYMEKVGASE